MYRKLLIPVANAVDSHDAAHAGLRFASDVGAEVVLLHVVPHAPAPFETHPQPDSTTHQLLNDLCAQASHYGTHCTVMTISHPQPWESIVAVARRKNCDLIFIGSHRRQAWGRLIFGSVTARVLAACDIAVLVHAGAAHARKHAIDETSITTTPPSDRLTRQPHA
ncbi:MAG TPA: universal stress protein [Burkholderiaceae bacterium]|nr:universal stress protein [Burkholderiaceae bacterium]